MGHGARLDPEGDAATSTQVGAHALAGGILSDLQGGKFGHGFFSAGFTKWAGKAWTLSPNKVIGNSLIQAMIGGTASKITGGKFANGAYTAALQYIVNEASKTFARSSKQIQEEKLALGASTKALGRVLNVSGAVLGLEVDQDGNFTVAAGADLENLKISLNSNMEASIIAGPAALVGTSFIVDDASSHKAVASFGVIEISVASFDNGVINFDIQLGQGAYAKLSRTSVRQGY
jgi:hypothetical protein